MRIGINSPRRRSQASRLAQLRTLNQRNPSASLAARLRASIANRYGRFNSGDRRVFRTALLAKSKSGNRSTRLGSASASCGSLTSGLLSRWSNRSKLPHRRERRFTGATVQSHSDLSAAVGLCRVFIVNCFMSARPRRPARVP